MALYQGPVRPTDDVNTFRNTGRTQQAPVQGPLPKGTTSYEESLFRKTGITVRRPNKSGGSTLDAARLADAERLVNANKQASDKAEQERISRIREQQQKAASQTTVGQLSQNKQEGFVIPKGNINSQVRGVTSSNNPLSFNNNIPIYTQPTIEKRLSNVDNTGIPQATFVLVTPPGPEGGIVKEENIKPSLINPGGTGISLEPEGYGRVDFFQEEVISDKPLGKLKPVTDVISGGVSGIVKSVGSSVNEIETRTREELFPNFTPEQAKKQRENIISTTAYRKEQAIIFGGALDEKVPIVGRTLGYAGYVGAELTGLGGGLIGSIAERTVKNPILYPAKIATLGAVSTGIGFGIAGVSAGASSLSPILGTATRGASIIGGGILTGTYAVTQGSKIVAAKDVYERGGILGETAIETSVVGAGLLSGEKLFVQARGLYLTRGRTFLETKQGEYPTAPVKEQLKLFRKNIITELEPNKPGAFHTTSQIFFGEKQPLIKPTAGTSELPGLYASTQVSTPFARIPGSSSTSKSKGIIENFKLLLQPPVKPGVAYLVPESFSYGKAIRKGNVIGEQKFDYLFANKARPGVAEVPGIKTEIEAVFRQEAGDYTFKSGKYYTKIEDVRVPIDVFEYKKGTGIKSKGVLESPKLSETKLEYPKLSSTPRSLSFPSSSNPLVRRTYLSSSTSSSVLSSVSKSYNLSSSGSSSTSSIINRSSTSYSSSVKSSLNLPSYNYSSASSSSGRSGSPKGITGKNLADFGSSGFGSLQLGKQITRYQPSFTASALRITAKKAPRFAGGLSISPIITNKKLYVPRII